MEKRFIPLYITLKIPKAIQATPDVYWLQIYVWYGILWCIRNLIFVSFEFNWDKLLLNNLFIAIGYGRIANVNTKTVTNKTRGNCLALYILALGGSTRFEFLFTDVSGDTQRQNQPIFQSVFDIYQ